MDKIELWMVFEAVAADEESAEKSLDEHIDALESEEYLEIKERNEDEVKEVENPHPSIEKGYNKVVETVLEVEGFDKAVRAIINYGPTYVQMEAPSTYEMGLKEGQEALQDLANTMHQYANKGPGGVLISRKAEEE